MACEPEPQGPAQAFSWARRRSALTPWDTQTPKEARSRSDSTAKQEGSRPSFQGQCPSLCPTGHPPSRE